MAPTIPGTNQLTECEDKLVTAIANSDAFQTYVSAANATEALNSIRVGEVEDATGATDEHSESDWNDKFPIAIVEDTEGAIEYEHTSDGGPYGYTYNTSITVAIEGKRPSGATNEDAHRTFKNTCLDIMQQVIGFGLADITNKYYVTRMTHSPILWSEPDVEGSSDVMRMEFLLVNETS